ncbi:glutamate-5-semialdehyde dehydrogenase [Fusobacterium sp. PH5-44]|uniref:glutamate-5-semialdehyde dehydrogenase n=1 Tax=unclassified Fusobacterium TaxID=2648384 RepID=UPI003D1AFB24
MDLIEIGKLAKSSSEELAKLNTEIKNKILLEAANAILSNKESIIAANKEDVENAIKMNIKSAFIDRLTLTIKRIEDMAQGLIDLTSLSDPVGEYIFNKTLPNGLIIGQKRVPLGVIGIIFESRPNVTADAFGLCFKSGNAVILRGGKEAIRSNNIIVKIFQEVLKNNNLPEYSVQVLTNTSRETANEMMKLDKYIDVLIPRGGASLIQTVAKNSTIPCIQTGVGNCHIFVDELYSMKKAVDIIINAKAQRPGVCNAAEKLLVHENIAQEFLPIIGKHLTDNKIEIRGDKVTLSHIDNAIPAKDIDWDTEYEDYIIAIKVVKNIDEAIIHINKYNTKHSEAIITENYTNAQRFLNEIDAAAVYVNASTRFTDGAQFGFGAEIGISTQKLHSRGPMGLKELTTTKYTIYGNGQIRK